MQIQSECCGSSIGHSRAIVTTRQIMAYAAGIGAERDCYLDDLREGGIIAPPAFIVSLEWPIMNGTLYRQSLRASDKAMYASVHVLQDTRFHRPIRPGDHLETSGRIVEVRPTRAGALVGSHLQTIDLANGRIVAESHFAAIFLRVTVAGEARSILEPPPLRPDRGIVGDAEHSVPVAIERSRPHVYTECAAIWNPIHTELAEARDAKLPDIILHGTCTWALAAENLIDLYCSGNPAMLNRLGGRFHGVVIPGTSATVRARHRSDLVDFVVENAAGELAITNGVAEINGLR